MEFIRNLFAESPFIVVGLYFFVCISILGSVLYYLAGEVEKSNKNDKKESLNNTKI